MSFSSRCQTDINPAWGGMGFCIHLGMVQKVSYHCILSYKRDSSHAGPRIFKNSISDTYLIPCILQLVICVSSHLKMDDISFVFLLGAPMLREKSHSKKMSRFISQECQFPMIYPIFAVKLARRSSRVVAYLRLSLRNVAPFLHP